MQWAFFVFYKLLKKKRLTFIKNKNTIVSNIIKIELTIIAMYFIFFVFDISSFIEIRTGINKTQL